MSALKESITRVGGVAKASAICGVSQRAIYKWIAADSLPRTEYSGGSVTPLNTGAGPGVAAMGGGGTSVCLSMPIMVVTDEESGRPEGAELDTEAFQRNMQERMRTVAREEIAKSWRQGGVSSRNVKG